MSHAAKPYGPKDGGTWSGRVLKTYVTPPDWVITLALACDMAGNVGVVADQLGYSRAVIHAVLNKAYKGRADRVEAKARGILMAAEVFCPAAGMSIGRGACADNQRRKPSCANPTTAKFPAACRVCKNSFGGNNASER